MTAMKMRSLVLGIALATALPVSITRAAAPPDGIWAAPFSPSGTIYRPDCSIKEDTPLRCGGGI
jgi:hypothetical protein